MADSFTNTDITKIKETINDYYNSLIIDEDKTERSDNKVPYFFDTMKNISTVKSDDFYFNQFINQCINYKIGKNNNNNDMLNILQQNNNANVDKINNIQIYINTISVIIDILEAYKHYIDNNENYINSISQISTIKLALIQPSSTLNNGTYDNNKTLLLNIKSFSINTNNIFTQSTSTSTTPFQIFNKFSDDDKTILTPYILPINTKSKLEQCKDIINNLLYFLINITDKNAKIEIYSLYYYYKLIKCYMLLTCSSTNITINDISNITINIHNIRLTSNNSVNTSPQTLLSSYNNNIRSVSDIKKEYDNVLKYIFNELTILQKQFYKNSNNILKELETSDYIFKINFDINPPNSRKIKLSYDDNINNIYNINTIINNDDKIKLLKNNYYIFNNNNYYKIIDINKVDKIIIIEAKYYNNTDNDAINIPSLPFETTETTGNFYELDKCSFVSSNFITLKKDYYNNKDILNNINDDIKINSLKLNSVKSNYNNNKNIDDTLNTQINAIHIILTIIIIVFIGVLIIDIDNGIKKLVALTILGIILLIMIILYIMNSKNNTIEEFTTITDLNNENKIDFLQKKYSIFNAQAKIYIDTIKQFIKNIDSKDLYDDLLHIMDKEKYDKQYISNILDHKRILGTNNIDVYKYDYYNKQIYINTILISALFVIILYLVYNMNPNIEKNLLVFIGLILFILIATYYIINTNNLVHSKSSHYYWKPMDLSRI